MFINNFVVQRSVRSLTLDPDNPRLIGVVENTKLKKQTEIIKALIEKFDVIEICNSIMSNGFYPEFNIVTIPKNINGNGLIVVEGNRRTCACKVILKPSLLEGTRYEYLIKKYLKNPNYELIKSNIEKLNVVVLDDRDAAETYKALKHTRQSIKSWSPYTQGAYFCTKLRGAITLAEVKDSLNLTEMKISQIYRVVYFYRLATVIIELKCWNEDERNYLNDNKDILKIEAIVRLLQSSIFVKEFGWVKLDNKGLIIREKLSLKKFNKIIEILTRDSHFLENKREGDFILTTRQENKSQIFKYVEFLSEIISGLSTDDLGEDNFKPENIVEISNDEDEDELIPIRSRKGKNKWERLLPDTVIIPNKYEKLSQMVNEAIKTNIKIQRYSAALLARSIFEITLKIWIKDNALDRAIKEKYRDNAYDFSNLLKFSLVNINELIKDDKDSMKSIRQVINGLLENDKEILNLTNHNDAHILSEKEIFHIRDKLKTFAEYFFAKMQA